MKVITVAIGLAVTLLGASAFAYFDHLPRYKLSELEPTQFVDCFISKDGIEVHAAKAELCPKSVEFEADLLAAIKAERPLNAACMEGFKVYYHPGILVDDSNALMREAWGITDRSGFSVISTEQDQYTTRWITVHELRHAVINTKMLLAHARVDGAQMGCEVVK